MNFPTPINMDQSLSDSAIEILECAMITGRPDIQDLALAQLAEASGPDFEKGQYGQVCGGESYAAVFSEPT